MAACHRWRTKRKALPARVRKSFDPATGTSISPDRFPPRHVAASRMLLDGRVLRPAVRMELTALNTPTFFDPPPTPFPRASVELAASGHSATSLLDGRVSWQAEATAPLMWQQRRFTISGQEHLPAASCLWPRPAVTIGNLAAATNSVLILAELRRERNQTASRSSRRGRGRCGHGLSVSSSAAEPATSALSQDGLLADGRRIERVAHKTSSAELYGFATVKTDRRGLRAGSIVTITGTGWQPGETVHADAGWKSPLVDTHP